MNWKTSNHSAQYAPSGRGPSKERHASDALPGMSVFTKIAGPGEVRKWPVTPVGDCKYHGGRRECRMAGNCSKHVLQAFLVLISLTGNIGPVVAVGKKEAAGQE